MLGLLPEPAKPLPQGSQAGQGPKQAERSSTLWKSPIKGVEQVGAPARSIFSAHRVQYIEQGTPPAHDRWCCSFTLPRSSHAGGRSTGAVVRIRPRRMWVVAKIQQEGWV